MRIIYFITKSEMGGAQTYVASLADYMIKEGHKVAVASDNQTEWLGTHSRDLGVQFFENRFFKNSYNPINAFYALKKTRKIIKEFNPDVIHSNSGIGGFFARLAAIGLCRKNIFTAHGWSFRKGVPIIQQIVGWTAEFLMSFFTAHTICVSNYDRNIGRRSGVISLNSSTVIHNGVPINDLIALTGTHDKFVILFAGRLAKPKRQDLAIEATSLLPETIKDNVILVCAGDGPSKNNLKKLAIEFGVSSNVRFEVYKTEDMGQIYSESDILILVSDYEGLPMTILEAMSYGLPVLANNVGGIKEAVDLKTGFMLSSRPTAQEIAKNMESLIKLKSELKILGEYARQKIQNNFTREVMCKKTLEIYAKI